MVKPAYNPRNGEQRQEDLKLENSLGYMMRTCLNEKVKKEEEEEYRRKLIDK
jgi:hypothetical protein